MYSGFLTKEAEQQKLLKKGFTLIAYHLEGVTPLIIKREPGGQWQPDKADFMTSTQINDYKKSLLKSDDIFEIL
jgi:hypothetical protein